MIKVQWYKILQDLWLYKARTILILAAITVGVSAVGMTSTAEIMLRRNIYDSYNASHQPDAILSLSPFSSNLIEALERLPEIQHLEARRLAGAELEIAPDTWLPIDIHAIPNFHALSINKLELDSRAIVPPPRGALLLERSIQGMPDAQIDSHVRVRFPDGKVKPVQVAGWIHDIAPWPSNISLFAVGYTTPETLADLLPKESRDANQLYITLAGDGVPSRTQVEQTVALLKDEIEKRGYSVWQIKIPEPGKPVLDSYATICFFILGIFAFFTLVLSTILVLNVMSALMNHQIPQVGVFKALGSQRTQIVKLYLQMVLVIGLLAMLISLPLGFIGARFLTNVLAGMMNFDVTSFDFPLRTFLLQVLGTLGVPVFAALVPIWNGAGITIRQAINQTGLADSNPFINQLLAHIEGLPTIINLAMRNVFRKSERMVLTLAALSLGGAIFIAVLGVRQAMLITIGDVMALKNFDVEVRFTDYYSIQKIEREATIVPGVIAAEAWIETTINIEHSDARLSETFQLYGVPTGSQMTQPFVRQGRWWSNNAERELFITANVVDIAPFVRVEDNVTIKQANYERPWRVVGQTGAIALPQGYGKFEEVARVTGAHTGANLVVVKTEQHDLAFQTVINERLKEHFRQLNMPISYSRAKNSLVQSAEAQLNIIITLLILMALLIGSVGGLGLASTMGLNVLERTREIGILRSLGAKNQVVWYMVIAEGELASLVSFLIAIFLSVPVSLGLGTVIGQQIILRPLDYTFSWVGMSIWLGIILVIALLASLLPADNAVRLTIRETLAYTG